MKEVGPGYMDVTNHLPSDGLLQDDFERRSMHLTLTEYSLPFTTREHKNSQAIEAFFQEAVISILDRAEWIADLDVLKSFEKMTICRQVGSEDLHDLDCCPKSRGAINLRKASLALTSVASWPGFIDRPSEAAIVRASRNWIVRLVASRLSVQSGHTTVVLFCYRCSGDYLPPTVDSLLPMTFIL